ncbi:hypothetical protein KGF57_001089 [Candida theae]|uniref:K Homology domain-containing protein n=1 Tax=Candida theae TaxID=1198502 RepID=A0AAD5BI96_9ASCO|nr:uncharacterized protein KGF57_001089 [Candida theae]KAI5964416.1 hypothetical protein KGF57_001089 [Candida theae]
MESAINSLLLSSQKLRFKINSALLEKNSNGNTQPLTLLATTPVLSKFIQRLIETKSLNCQPNLNADLFVEKHMGCPYWDLNFTSKYAVEVLQLLAEIQFATHNQIQIRGPLTQCFKLGGTFSNGIISIHKVKVNDVLLERVIACDKIESIIHTPQLVTSDEIPNRDRYQAESSCRGPDAETDASQPKTSVSTTLSFNRHQIKRILGPGGARLDSIRLQSKCWIHIDRNPLENCIDDSLRFISKNNTKQVISISGLKPNVDIAINEIYNCLEREREREKRSASLGSSISSS